MQTGFAESRQKAQRLLKDGCVKIDGVTIQKPSEPIDETVPHDTVILKEEKYVSRGGLKLEGAMDAFSVEVQGLTCLDVGASTGGFTDCLLQRGANRVYAFDAGKNQLHPRIAVNPRVCAAEGINARFLTPSDVGEAVDLVVMDVSFISQTLILPVLPPLMKPDGRLISLIKPQFEAGKSALGKNGIVRKPADRKRAVERVILCAESAGFACFGLMRSPIEGGDGNEEFLAAFALRETRRPDKPWQETLKTLTTG